MQPRAGHGLDHVGELGCAGHEVGQARLGKAGGRTVDVDQQRLTPRAKHPGEVGGEARLARALRLDHEHAASPALLGTAGEPSDQSVEIGVGGGGSRGNAEAALAALSRRIGAHRHRAREDGVMDGGGGAQGIGEGERRREALGCGGRVGRAVDGLVGGPAARGGFGLGIEIGTGARGTDGGRLALVLGAVLTRSGGRRHEEVAADDARAGEQEGQHGGKSDDRQLLGEGGQIGHHRTGDDAGIGRARILGVARGGLAVAGEVGFELLALRLRLALQGTQLHLAGIALGHHVLLAVDGGAQALDPRARDLGVVLEGAHDPLGRSLDLALQILNLRGQFLDAGMGRQQRARFERELRAHRHAALDGAPDQLVVGDIGNLEGPPLLDHVFEELGAGAEIRLDGAGLRELARQLGELLGGERLGRIAAADADQAVLGAEGFHLRLSLGDAGAQGLDVVA